MHSALINGAPSRAVDIGDRGLLYGDGLFETIAVREGRPLLWSRHLQRLQAGCRRLTIAAPDGALLEDEARRLCAGLERAVLKIIVTRGGGGRGYRPPHRAAATRMVSTHPWPDYPARFCQEGVAVRVCRTRLAVPHPLAGLKHLNRLEQVMARSEWDDPDVPEGLMLGPGDRVIAGTMSNLFLVNGDRLITPDLSGAGVAGTVRGLILELAPAMGLAAQVGTVSPADLKAADEVFLCNSLLPLWPVTSIDGAVRPGPGPVSRRIAARVADHSASDEQAAGTPGETSPFE